MDDFLSARIVVGCGLKLGFGDLRFRLFLSSVSCSRFGQTSAPNFLGQGFQVERFLIYPKFKKFPV